MSIVTAAPVSPLARLRAKLKPLPPPTAAQRAEWKRIAAMTTPVQVTDDAPDVSIPTPGLVECAPPDAFVIGERLAQWYRSHGGSQAVARVLRQHMRAEVAQAAKRKRTHARAIRSSKRR